MVENADPEAALGAAVCSCHRYFYPSFTAADHFIVDDYDARAEIAIVRCGVVALRPVAHSDARCLAGFSL
jgi:hypothetical protein